MDFTCVACGTKLTTKELTAQKLSVPSCFSDTHRGPFEPIQLGQTETRPEIINARTTVEA